MAQPPNNSHPTHSFLACFGSSRKIPSHGQSPEATLPSDRKIKTRPNWWFSWPRPRLKSSASKTVPADHTASKPVKFISKKKVFDQKISSANHKLPRQVSGKEILEPDKAAGGRPVEAKRQLQPNKALRKKRNSDLVQPPKFQTRLSFCRKVDVLRNGLSLPESTDHPKPKASKLQTPTTKLSHSVSLPAPTRQIQVVKPAAEFRVTPMEQRRVGGRFDPVVGLSIVMITLLIMLLWGRLCAVLCTSAGFYVFPRLRNTIGAVNVAGNGGNGNPGNLDLNSVEHKKKVVLEGLLERNHRCTK